MAIAPPAALAQQALNAPAVEEAPAPSQDALANAIKGVLSHPNLRGARVGVHVVDALTGELLYAHDAQRPYNPASNAKLITSAAALDAFGPSYTFTTRLWGVGVEGGKVRGGLMIEGNGEGFLLYDEVLDWAATIKARGITEIEGGIHVTQGPFKDGAYLPPGFEQKDEDASYRAPIGPVSVNFNAISVIVSPNEEAGQPALVRTDPPSAHLTIVNEVTTSTGRRRQLSVRSVPIVPEGESDPTGTRIEVRGHIGQRAEAWRSRSKRIDVPPAHTAGVLQRALEALGIKVSGPLGEAASLPSDRTEFVAHASEPLSYVVMAMNKWSNNFMAEQMFRALGTTKAAGDERGSWKDSRSVVMSFLQDQKIDTKGLALHNGSGLYDGNLVSPAQLTGLLVAMRRHSWWAEYASSLAISGTDGTMANRLGGPYKARVRAKTGTLNEVTALSGYATTDSGREVAFSILINDPPMRAYLARPQQDAIARAILQETK